MGCNPRQVNGTSQSIQPVMYRGALSASSSSLLANVTNTLRRGPDQPSHGLLDLLVGQALEALRLLDAVFYTDMSAGLFGFVLVV
ncbi:hypothetical protein VDGL01_07833 [Verticillium dahliae]